MYRLVETSLWTDPTVLDLPAQDKLIFLYLITNPHTHVSGIYYLPVPLALFELKLPEIGYRTGIDRLSDLGLVHFDEKTNVVWVVNMMHHQARGEKNFQSAATHLQTLHNSCLIQGFLLRYPEVKPFYSASQPIGYRRGIGGVSPQEQEQEQEQEQKQEQKQLQRARAAAGQPQNSQKVKEFTEGFQKRGVDAVASRRLAKATDPDLIPVVFAFFDRNKSRLDKPPGALIKMCELPEAKWGFEYTPGGWKPPPDLPVRGKQKTFEFQDNTS